VGVSPGDLKLPPAVTAAIDALENAKAAEARCGTPDDLADLTDARAALERAIADALREALVVRDDRIGGRRRTDPAPGARVVCAHDGIPHAFGPRCVAPPPRAQIATLEGALFSQIDLPAPGAPMPCVDCGAVPDHVYCSPRAPGARCKPCHDKIPRDPEPPPRPAPADLACALRDVIAMYDGTEDGQYGYSTGPIEKLPEARALLARVPPGWLR
jgi:hypothetical protein